MKTVQEYLNDPRMLNDPDMAAALEPVKEIYAARLMIQDETAGMTAAQKSEYLKKKYVCHVCQHGASPSANRQSFRPGQAKASPTAYLVTCPFRCCPAGKMRPIGLLMSAKRNSSLCCAHSPPDTGLKPGERARD
jgi:hypothetical protein